MQTISPPSLKRLSRPEMPPGFRITSDDIEILRAVAKFRFLSTPQIVRFMPRRRSEWAVSTRARKLFWHGFLDRPENQRVHLAALHNPPLVYGLGKAGARKLAEVDGTINPTLDWKTKNTRATAPFLSHTLQVADTMIEFYLASRAAGSPTIRDHSELLPYMPVATRRRRNPFMLRVTVKHQFKEHDIAVVPDRLFACIYPDGDAQAFALEQDCGTEDINARRLAGKSSFRKKLMGYFQARNENLHTTVWGFAESFRVFTVCDSEIRIQHMIDAQREVTDNSLSGLFLYTTPKRLAAEGAFAPVWRSSKNDGISIIPKR